MTTVEVGNNERIGFEPKRNVVRLTRAAAGARIEFQFAVSTVVPNPTVSVLPFQVDADLFVSRLSNQNERMVCRLSGEHLVSPTANGTQLTLAGYISADQLREIEEIRAGGDFSLHLVLRASTVANRVEANPRRRRRDWLPAPAIAVEHRDHEVRNRGAGLVDGDSYPHPECGHLPTPRMAAN